MKKMIIVDVPDEMGDDVKALHITLSNGKYIQDIRMNEGLIDFPRKRETVVYWKRVGVDIPRYYQSIGQGNIPTHEISEYDKGWNDCVSFLLGEE